MTEAAAAKGKQARQYFEEGCNCSQSVLLAFAPECGLTREQALKLASSFGGGFGRMRELCGAVSSAGIVLGMLHGYTELTGKAAKQRHYRRVQIFCERFRELHGHLRCGDLLAGLEGVSGLEPAERTPEYYAARPCGQLCHDAAAILADLLEELEQLDR